MKFKTLNGREVNKNITKWLVKWDKPCKSQFQYRIKQFFRPFWEHSCVGEEFVPPCGGGVLYIDLINFSQKIVCETMGSQHDNYNAFFHSGSRTNFLSGIKRDVRKSDWIAKNGYKLIEIYPDDEKKLSPAWI